MKERQIDYRSYSSKYAVVYQDLELKCPEIELCWTTVSDQAIKPVQTASTLGQRLDAPQEQERPPR